MIEGEAACLPATALMPQSEETDLNSKTRTHVIDLGLFAVLAPTVLEAIKEEEPHALSNGQHFHTALC